MLATVNIFSGGEISPDLTARFDISQYQKSAKLMQNFVPLTQGGVIRRSGLRYIGLTKDQTPSSFLRLQAFIYSASQGRILEFGQNYMRVWLPDGTLVKTASNEIYELETPYSVEHVTELSIVQSADVLFIAHASYPPHKITRFADNNFVIEELTFIPSIATPTLSSVEQIGTTTVEEDVTNEYLVTAFDEAYNESSSSNIVIANSKALSEYYYNKINYSAVENAVEYRIYKKRAGIFGFIGRTKDTYFDDKNILPDTADTPIEHKNPFANGNYPSITFLFQQRLGFASSNNQPLTIWLSQSANLNSFASSSPPAADDAIEATLSATQVNRILAVSQVGENLALFTEGNEWLVVGSSGILTPTSIGFELQSSYGIEPFSTVLQTNDSTLYTQRGSNAVRAFGYRYETDNYQSLNLSILAQHLLKDTQIYTWAYQKEPYSIIWAATTSGELLGLNYLQQENVLGWHQHKTDGFVEYITSIPGQSNDKVFAIVLRKKGDGSYVRTIEMLESFFEGEKEYAFFVDSGVSHYETFTNAKTNTIYGLDHLEGKLVQIFADGTTIPEKVVTNGKIELEDEYGIIHVGLPFESRLIPTSPEFMLQNGASLFKLRKISNISLRLYQSMSFLIGIENDDKTPLFEHSIENVDGIRAIMTTPQMVNTADISLVLAGGYDNVNYVDMLVNTPTPACILAFTTTMDLANLVGTQKT